MRGPIVRRWWKWLFSLASLLVLITPGWAQTPVGEIFPIRPGADCPAAAVDPSSGNFLVLWIDSSIGVGGQLVSQDGALLGGAFPVHSLSGSVGSCPVLAFNSQAHEFLVVFADLSGILGQRLAPDGTLVGEAIPISTAPSPRALEHPALAYDGYLNRYLVAWDQVNLQPYGNGGGIRSEMIAADGTPAGPVLNLSPGVYGGTIYGARSPSVAFNSATRQFLVAWYAIPDGSNPKIYVTRILLDGTEVTSPLEDLEAVVSSPPSVTANPLTQQFYMVWSRGIYLGGSDVHGGIIDADGNLVRTDVIDYSRTYAKNDPMVIYVPGAYVPGGYPNLAIWESDRTICFSCTDDGCDCVVDAFTSGSFILPDGSISPLGRLGGLQGQPFSASSSTRTVLVVWREYSNGDGIFGQLNPLPFSLPCLDRDGDGYGSPGDPTCPRGDQEDCDDINSAVFPGNSEVCDGLDDNCNGSIDEGFPDTDGDGAADCHDNCPLVWNPGQSDADQNGLGNACEEAALFAGANIDDGGFSSNRIDGRDLTVLANSFGTCPGDPGYDGRANLDGIPGSAGPPGSCVDMTDFHLFMEQFARIQ